jgi:hypothetical protein
LQLAIGRLTLAAISARPFLVANFSTVCPSGFLQRISAGTDLHAIRVESFSVNIWAITGVRLVDPSRRTLGNKRYDNCHEVDSAFVSHDVHVVTFIDERFPGPDHVWRAGRVVAQVKRGGSGRDDHQAGSGVAVPAECPAGQDRVPQDMEVRGSFRVDVGLPVARLRIGVNVVEGGNTKRLCRHARWGRSAGRRGPDYERQCDEKWQNYCLFELS